MIDILNFVLACYPCRRFDWSPTCHGYKLQADHKLCLGDKLGYLEILRVHNFDMVRIERALTLYGL